MIKARTLLVLVAITAAVVVGALVTSKLRTPVAPAKTEEHVLPDLSKRINDVAEIEIATTNDRRIDLKRTPDGWLDASRGGYPARFEPVKQLLIALSEAQIAEHKTSDPANYAKLSVNAPTDEGSNSTLVTLRDQSGAPIASLIIGQRMSGGGGRFVRVPDQSEVLLTAGDLNVSPAPLGWLERDVMRIPRDEVERVAVAQPSGDSFTIYRKDDGTLDMLGVPQGRRVRAQSPLSGMMGALAYVDFLDVKPASDIDFSTLAQPYLATYQTKDGMEIDVSVWTDDKRKWTTFTIAKAADAPSQSPESTEAPADAAGSDKSAAKPQSLDDKIASLQKKVDGWVFEISPSSLVPIETSMLELTQEAPPPPPAGAQNGPPAPSPSGPGAGSPDQPADQR